ncbi:serine/threonine-protein kinase [Sorangium sp. Soce836]|uniref:serine/threonine-protein kinase n=1 Tax=Sorangium sp. So ce836 TaxID=2969250 RepID=UPI00234FE70E|nr:serine/threonine-protein kinase [Sorangium sp. Soce836]WCQ88221.1 serine-threonine kinase [Sorangium sp. Soce836]
MDITPGTIVGGKYLLERQLVRPGARLARDRGSVWVARELQLGGRVALKLFHPDAGATGEHLRIDRCVRAAVGLSSRHVVRVHDHGAEGDVVYLAMDLLSGEDLATRLLRRSRLSLQEAARIAAQAGEALRCAHAADLLHQGLRPESFFLALDGGEEVVKVLDLGLPRPVAPRLLGEVAAEVSASSLHYLSPEQIRSERTLDALTDLWSLAAVLFRAVTGQLPFPGDIASVVASKILLAPPPAATQLVPSLPAALDGFFEKAFARDLARRFRSIEEMVDALVGIADLAPPPSSGVLRPPPPARVPPWVASARPLAALSAEVASDVAARADPGPEPPSADQRAAPDTLLSAESADVLRGLDGPHARGAWILSAGLVALLGAVALATSARLDRPAPAMAVSGARAAVLSASLAVHRAAPLPAAPEAASSAYFRRAPHASPQRSAHAATAAPPHAAPPRPARPGSSAGPARVRHGFAPD